MIAWLARLYEIPYWVRAAGVGVLLTTTALADLARNGARATRWREYAFWLACAGAGALFALGTDLVTSRISRAYFVLGKGLSDDGAGGFDFEVAVFAVRAGSVAGLAVGGALLLANNPKVGVPRLGYRELGRLVVAPAVAALACAAIAGAVTSWDVEGLANELRGALTDAEVRLFLLVQRLHAGLYLGALLGTIGAVIRARRRRRALS